ncbi:MAG: hypothetical protein U1E65_03830 [Myxococcota bacterium]
MKLRCRWWAFGLLLLVGCSAETSGLDATSADGGMLAPDAPAADLGAGNDGTVPVDTGTADDVGISDDTGIGVDTGVGEDVGFGMDHTSGPDLGTDAGPEGQALISAFAGSPASNFVVASGLRTQTRTVLQMPPPALGATCDAYGHRLVTELGKLFALWWSNDRPGCPNILVELDRETLGAHAARATLPSTPLAMAQVSPSALYAAATGTTSVLRLGYPDLSAAGEIAIGLTTTVALAQYAPLQIRATSSTAYVAMGGRYQDTRLPTVIVAIDPETNTPLDLEPAQPGLQGITLAYRGFAQMRITPDGQRLVVLSRGLDDGQFEHRADGGLEIIDLSTNQVVLRVPATNFGIDGRDFDLLRSEAAIVGAAMPSDPSRPALIEVNLALGSLTVFAASPGRLEYRLVRLDPNGNVWAARTEHDAVTTLDVQVVDVFAGAGSLVGTVPVGAQSVATSIEFRP